jgi:hypothetical protein
MSRESRRLAGLLLVILPTVMIGGVSILTLLVNDPAYVKNPLRQDLWRAGHAHAGVLLVLSLVVLRYVDEAELSASLKGFVRLAGPSAAILMPAALRPPAGCDRAQRADCASVYGRSGTRRRYCGPGDRTPASTTCWRLEAWLTSPVSAGGALNHQRALNRLAKCVNPSEPFANLVPLATVKHQRGDSSVWLSTN